MRASTARVASTAPGTARANDAGEGDKAMTATDTGSNMKVCDKFSDLGRDDPSRQCRLGIFGGTFDPVHVGHLAAAENVRETLGLDAVVFMPAGVPVFKLDKKVTPGEDRLAMCRLAVADNPFFDVSDIEVRRPGNTYTYETLRVLREHFPANVSLYFIAGADAILSLGKWRNALEISQLAHIVGMARPGYSSEAAAQAIYAEGQRIEVDFVEVPGLDISSSHVRASARCGRSIRYVVTDEVRDYIMDARLYC